MDTANKASKRLVVHDRKDADKWISLDISNAQPWELEASDSDWNAIDGFPHRRHERTLYRLPDKSWVLVETTFHFDLGQEGPPTFEVLTNIQAAEQLLLSGHTPPEDVIHLVRDKLALPPPSPAATETSKANEGEQLTNAEAARRMFDDILGPPPVKTFGPVRDDCSGDETTLFQYPYNRWILFTDPAYQAAGNRYEPLTPVGAVEWFLNHGLEVPVDLYDYLPTIPVEGSKGQYGQRFGPVGDDFGNETTLIYYSPDHWVFSGRRSGERWHSPVTPAEATYWLLDNGLDVPPILFPYLPVPAEKTAPQPDFNENISEPSKVPGGTVNYAATKNADGEKTPSRLAFKDSAGRYHWFNPSTATWFHSELRAGGFGFVNLCRLPDGRWLFYSDPVDSSPLVEAQELTNEQAIDLILSWGRELSEDLEPLAAERDFGAKSPDLHKSERTLSNVEQSEADESQKILEESQKYKKGPRTKAERTERRDELITQAIGAGITEPEEIFELIKGQDLELVKCGKNFIDPQIMMKKYWKRQRAKDESHEGPPQQN